MGFVPIILTPLPPRVPPYSSRHHLKLKTKRRVVERKERTEGIPLAVLVLEPRCSVIRKIFNSQYREANSSNIRGECSFLWARRTQLLVHYSTIREGCRAQLSLGKDPGILPRNRSLETRIGHQSEKLKIKLHNL